MSKSFHPAQNLPGCMMPDGGECCAGHIAVCEDWHKQRRRIEALEAALRHAREAIFWHRAEGFEMDGGKTAGDVIDAALAMNSQQHNTP